MGRVASSFPLRRYECMIYSMHQNPSQTCPYLTAKLLNSRKDESDDVSYLNGSAWVLSLGKKMLKLLFLEKQFPFTQSKVDELQSAGYRLNMI